MYLTQYLFPPFYHVFILSLTSNFMNFVLQCLHVIPGNLQRCPYLNTLEFTFNMCEYVVWSVNDPFIVWKSSWLVASWYDLRFAHLFTWYLHYIAYVKSNSCWGFAFIMTSIHKMVYDIVLNLVVGVGTFPSPPLSYESKCSSRRPWTLVILGFNCAR